MSEPASDEESDAKGAVDPNILKILNNVGAKDESIITDQRLGSKSTDKKRAIKVHLASVELKLTALRNAKTLAAVDEFKCIYLKPDLTPMQLSKQRALVTALRAANEHGKIGYQAW